MKAAKSEPRRVVALRYERAEEAAPRVAAQGAGEVGERILELAAEHGIPVREDRDLLELLAACDLGESLPIELYGAVAEVLAFLYRVNADTEPL